MHERIALLGRQAAIKYAQEHLPKRKSSHSKLFRAADESSKEQFGRALHQATKNVKSPHRYGRKVKRKVI